AGACLPGPPFDGSGTTTCVSSVVAPRGAGAGGCQGGAGAGGARTGATVGGSGTGPVLRGASGSGGATLKVVGGAGAGVAKGGSGIARVVGGGSEPGTGLRAPEAAATENGFAPGCSAGSGLGMPGSGGSRMAPVVSDEEAAAGESSSAGESTGTGFGPDRESVAGVPSDSSSPKSSPLCPRSSPWNSSAFFETGEGPQGMVWIGPGASGEPDAEGPTKEREGVPPNTSDRGAFHPSSGGEAGTSSWKRRGSGTEKRSLRVMGTSRSSSGTASDSGTEWPSSSRARMLSGSSFSACSKRRRAPSRSPLILSHRPASSSWFA